MALLEVDGLGGAAPVAGQFAHPGPGPVPAQVLQCLGHRRWARARRVGPEVLIERVLDEGVGEGVAARGVGLLADQGGVGGGLQDVEELVLGHGDGPGQQVEIEVAPDDRRHRQDAPGVRAEPTDPGADHLAHAVGQRQVVEGSSGHPAPGVVLADGARLDRWRSTSLTKNGLPSVSR